MDPDGTINWIYIVVVLLVRFAAVFVILGLLQAGILVAGRIISSIAPAGGKK